MAETYLGKGEMLRYCDNGGNKDDGDHLKLSRFIIATSRRRYARRNGLASNRRFYYVVLDNAFHLHIEIKLVNYIRVAIYNNIMLQGICCM